MAWFDNNSHMTIGKFLAVVIDCANPLGMSSFWQQLLGGQIDPNTSSQEWMSLSGVPGLGYLGFQKVPESKSIKNRVHIDVDVETIDDAVQRAIALGAEKSGEIVEEETNYFQVMLDPEKNEFCFVLRKGNT
jgi:predicted enzyme related to lactoylglutathione lyase